MKKFEHKNKDERRRVLLSKNNVKTDLSKDNLNTYMSSDAEPRTGAGVLAKVQGMNKRILAIILATVMVLGLLPLGWFSLRGRAESLEDLLPVTMAVRANGANNYTTVEIAPGNIEDNVATADFQNELPNGASYQKAVMRDNTTGSETEIQAVSKLKDSSGNEKTYYAFDKNATTGTLFKPDQELILVMSAKYEVTKEATSHGSFTTSALHDNDQNMDYVWGGTGLRIQATPDADYKVETITYTVGGVERTATVSNNAATIPANDITNDISINVTFAHIDNYGIYEVQYMPNTKFYPNLYGEDNLGGLTTGKTANDNGASDATGGKLRNAPTGQDAVFYLYSKSNTGGSNHVLNMLSINGVDIKYPTTTGVIVPTDFGNGRTVTVEMLETNAQLVWNNDTTGTRQYRTYYKITVPNVHEDLEVALNFKRIDDHQIIIKDMRGIEKTGYSVEHLHYWNRYYTFTQDKRNIYTSYFSTILGEDQTIIPSDNLLLYTIKPGYNPYTVTTEMSYDNGVTRTSQGIRDSQVTGSPEAVIKSAGNQGGIASNSRYDTDFRYWGKNTSLENRDQNYVSYIPPIVNDELLLTTVSKDTNNTWYAIALSQKNENNQQLYLNAEPLNYQLQLDTLNVEDVTFTTPTGYTRSDNTYTENSKHTVEDSTYIVTPAEVPTRLGYVFEGWELQLLDKNGTPSNTKVYQNNEQVPLSNEVLMSALGDPQTSSDMILKLSAIWSPILEADTTKVLPKIYYQDPSPAGTSETINNKTYNVNTLPVETQTTGEYVAFIDTHAPDGSKYYELNTRSHLEGYVQAMSDEDDFNEFTAIYDLKFVDFSLEKVVNGNISASQFDITLTLTRPADYPDDVDNDDVFSFITQDDNTVSHVIDDNEGTITFTKTFQNGDKVEFNNLPYGWNYTVAEAKSQDDNFDTIISTNGLVTHTRDSVEAASYTGTLEENTDVTVNNQRAYDDPNVVSDKWLTKGNDGTYTLTMETYATGKDVADEDAEVVPLDIALVIDQSGSMGTKDMYPDFFPTASKSWTVDEATGNQVYYYKPDPNVEKYYPVEAEEGTIYEKVATPPDVQAMKGWGHDSTVIGGNIRDFLTDGIGSRVTYNVPSSYYAIDENGKAHKVYLITVGGFAAYRAYAYYYTDAGAAEEQNAQEFYETIYWIRLLPPQWQPFDLYKTSDNTFYRQHGGTVNGLSHTDGNPTYAAWSSITDVFRNGSTYWMDLAYNRKVSFVGQPNASLQSAENAELSYSWISDGDRVNNLYLPKDGTTYNKLYYVDDDGEKQYFGNSVDIASASAYNGVLYTVEGRATRLEALQSAVTDFTELVAQNSAETGADHRIGIIGFAGNKFPANSDGQTVYNSTIYDYTNSGVFVNNQFHNYQTIESYERITGSPYINKHYYTSASGGEPVFYQGGNWYYLSGNRYTGNTFYEPVYSDLDESDYSGALVEASQKTGDVFNGSVNNNLVNAIDHFGYYGGTYTSYGMAMANNMFDPENGYDGTFEDSQGNTQDRKRIIIVFTDGEPGANGFSDAIAKEALADGNKAKYSSNDGGFNATVYTVGLFPGNITEQMEDFMRQLSSDYTVPSANVYGGTNNGVSATGSGTLDGDSTYYYLGDDGKTYSVTTQNEGMSTLGWWIKTNDSYIRCYPKNASNDSRKVNGEDVKQFFSQEGGSNNNRIYEPDLNENTVYFDQYSRPIKFEYRWYDSNNKVRDPIKQTYGQYDTTRNTYQFFMLGTPQDTSGGYEFYHPASNTEELAQAFVDAFDVIKAANMGNTMTLTDKTSFVKDALSEHFVWDDDNGDIELYLVGGGSKNHNDEVSFSGPTRAVTNADGISAVWDEDENAFIVTGFDFSKTYVDQNNHDAKANQKLRIVVTGLKPKVDQDTDTTGGNFESNLKESGVFKQEWDEDEQEPVDGSQKLLDAFPMPSISRYKYTITVDGDDTTATHATTFELLDDEGEPIANKSINDLKHDPINSTNWPNGTVQNTQGNQERSIILEQINDVVQFETRLTDDAFKHSDGIPDDYQVQYTVTGNGMNNNAYEFTKSIDKGNPSDYEDEDSDANGVNFTRIMSKDHNTTVDISSEEQTVLVNIQEITEAMDPNNDFSDPTKEFDIVLTLFERDGQTPATGYTYGDYEFGNDGTLEVPLANADSVTLEIPKGYYLAVDVKPSTQDGYTDTYRENGADVYESGNVLANEYEATQINSTTFIQVINKNEAPVVTGFNGIDSLVNPFIIAAGVVTLLGGAWLGIMAKRRRDAAKQ